MRRAPRQTRTTFAPKKYFLRAARAELFLDSDVSSITIRIVQSHPGPQWRVLYAKRRDGTP
jgi:hypothetical protein